MYNVFTQDIDLWAFNTEEGDTSHILVQSVLGRILFTEGGHFTQVQSVLGGQFALVQNVPGDILHALVRKVSGGTLLGGDILHYYTCTN